MPGSGCNCGSWLHVVAWSQKTLLDSCLCYKGLLSTEKDVSRPLSKSWRVLTSSRLLLFHMCFAPSVLGLQEVPWCFYCVEGDKLSSLQCQCLKRHICRNDHPLSKCSQSQTQENSIYDFPRQVWLAILLNSLKLHSPNRLSWKGPCRWQLCSRWWLMVVGEIHACESRNTHCTSRFRRPEGQGSVTLMWGLQIDKPCSESVYHHGLKAKINLANNIPFELIIPLLRSFPKETET